MKSLKYLTRNRHTLSLAGNIINAILGFGSFALIARLLSKDDMGDWMIFMTAYIFADLLRAGIIHHSLIRFAANTEEDQFKVVSGSGWLISILTTLVLSIITVIVDVIFGHYIDNEGIQLFLTWYWLAALITLPFNYAVWLLQAKSSYEKVLYIRVLNQLSFITCILLTLRAEKASIDLILAGFIISGLLPSLISVWTGWSMAGTVKFATRKMMNDLLNFRKFNKGTLIGTNLLRSSDTLLIGFMLSTRAVANYSIPLKLIEVIEVIIRSIASSALPVMAKFSSQEHKTKLRQLYNKYTGLLTILLLPLIIGCIVFAETLVMIMGGAHYAESANILRIMAIYTALLPIQQFNGTTLDLIGKPSQNFKKVILMLLVNITVGIMAINYFGNIYSVAALSVLTVLTGVVIGNHFLRKHLDQKIADTLKIGYSAFLHIIHPVRERIKALNPGNSTS